jgi:hypothetical protein
MPDINIPYGPDFKPGGWTRRYPAWKPGIDGPSAGVPEPLFAPMSVVLEDGVLWFGSWHTGCAYGASPWRRATDKERDAFIRNNPWIVE